MEAGGVLRPTYALHCQSHGPSFHTTMSGWLPLATNYRLSCAQLGSTRAVSEPGRPRVVSHGETCSKLGGTAPNEAFVIPDSTRKKANFEIWADECGLLADKDLAPQGHILN